jgi:Na+/H+-dicarboxylate symporter
MGRTATNVLGNAVAATLVANWEGELKDGWPAELESPA